jgi:hypothetical protein
LEVTLAFIEYLDESGSVIYSGKVIGFPINLNAFVVAKIIEVVKRWKIGVRIIDPIEDDNITNLCKYFNKKV